MALTTSERESQGLAGLDPREWQFITGETDIDDSEQTETTAWPILTIAPVAGKPLLDCEVWIDLAKATTGFAAVETSATITFAVARKVDGTNWRREVINEAALSGTNAANRMQRIKVGPVDSVQGCRIYATMSADATSDMELPFVVAWRGAEAPTVTPVVAG